MVGLIFSDVCFSIEVILIIFVDVKVVGFELTDNGDMGRFFEIPELETGHFVDDDRFWSELV